ncbi:hypothetical protein PO909_012280 [Leuciscus waleckii]
MVDYAQPSTSADALSQESPQTPEEEPTPATDALEPMVDYAQPSTSADALSELDPTGSFNSRYELGKELPRVPHTRLYEGIRKSDGTQVIIKLADKYQMNFQIGDSKIFCREAAIMRMVEHSDHAVKLHDWFDMKDHDILIMEHPGVSVTLCDFIKENRGRLTEAEVKDIMQNLIAALRHCSEKDIYYKYISLSKVLINPDTRKIKLGGFHRALFINETDIDDINSIEKRRIHALMATNNGLYRALKGMAGGKSLVKLLRGNTLLFRGQFSFHLNSFVECLNLLDLLRKLRDRKSGITLQNILDHDWLKETPEPDAIESEPTEGNMQFEGMDSSSAQPSTSADALSQESPQTPEEEPTPATDALEPMVDYAQLWTCAVLSELDPTGSIKYHYEVGKRLTSVPHTRLYEGIRKSDGTQVIIKMVKKFRMHFQIVSFKSKVFCREAAIMWIIEHSDHAVKLYDWFDTEDYDILIMEHPGVSVTLCDFIKENRGGLTEAEVKDIMQNLIAALQHCRGQGVYHEHISLSKILINPDTRKIKLAGFNRALFIKETGICDIKSIEKRRIHALMATNNGLYRALKGMVGGKSLVKLLRGNPLLFRGQFSCHLNSFVECLNLLDLFRKLRDRKSGITLQNILDHDWLKETPEPDAIESEPTEAFLLAANKMYRSFLSFESSLSDDILLRYKNPGGSVLYELQLSYGLFGKASEESITIIHPAGDESMHKFL